MTQDMRPGSRPNPPSFMMQFYILWAALLASQGMIVIVSQTVMNQPRPGAPEISPGIAAPASTLEATGMPVWYLAVVAGVILLGAIFIPRLLAKASTKRLSDRNASLSEIAPKVLPLWILRWALLEAVTMLGFVASVLYARPDYILPFATVAAIGFILTFPTEQKIRATLTI